jgi:drug/metabolite transporter (DMT)-like permease
VTRARYVGELVVASACWGSDAVIVKYALRGIPAMSLLMLELLCATAALWAVLLVRGHRRPQHLWRLALLGLFEPGLTYAAVNYGLVRTSASDASLLAGTETLFVVVLAAIFLRQRLHRLAVLAVAVSAVGVGALGGSGASLSVGLGDLLVLAGSLAAAIYVTLASTIAPDMDPLTMTAYQFLAGTIVAVPFVLLQWGGRPGDLIPPGASAGYWVAGAGAGVIGLALSFLLYNHAIGHIHVTTASMVLTLIPLFGLAGAVLVLGEGVDAWEGVGAVLIVAGLLLFARAEGGSESEQGESEQRETEQSESEQSEIEQSESTPENPDIPDVADIDDVAEPLEASAYSRRPAATAAPDRP